MKCDRCDVGSARVQPVSYRTYTIYPPVCPFLVVQAKYHYPLLPPPPPLPETLCFVVWGFTSTFSLSFHPNLISFFHFFFPGLSFLACKLLARRSPAGG